MQKARTRLALVEAATRLIREGRSPTVPEVAEAALVSVPTAYRYFSNPQELWLDVAVRTGEPDPEQIFGANDPADLKGRVDAMVRAIARHQLGDEAVWRNVLRVSLERWFAQAQQLEGERVPVRGDRRLWWIDQALELASEQLDPGTRRKLAAALALSFGTEALVTVRDVCGLDDEDAVEVMAWAAEAMVDKALRESGRDSR